MQSALLGILGVKKAVCNAYDLAFNAALCLSQIIFGNFLGIQLLYKMRQGLYFTLFSALTNVRHHFRK
jgi:hypothetical protein